MKRLFYLFIFCSFYGLSQESVTAELKATSTLKAEQIFGVDAFGTLYYSDNGFSFCKKTTDTIISYANFQLGKITSANTFNPLKINLFYQDFNAVIILDNRLAEITKIDFNTTIEYKNVSLVSTGYDNTIWIFNQDLQRLELYDYLNNKTRIKTVPIQSVVIALKSDYNYCYLLTETFIYVYNYSGSLLRKIPHKAIKEMAFSKANLVLKSDNELFLLPKNSEELKAIAGLDLLIEQFLVIDETLYIYQDENLRQYKIKRN